MNRLKPGKIRVIAGTILLLSGLAALSWCGASLLRTYLYQKESAAALKREILPRRLPIALHPKPGALLGSLSIPRVGVRSVILEGADDRTLALSVGHIPGTAQPGREEGNVGLAGHRDSFFRGLRNIRKRDEVLLITPSGSQVYQVDSTRIVSPEEVSVLKDVGRPILTLVTCYPFYYIGAAPKRFIVQAHLMER